MKSERLLGIALVVLPLGLVIALALVIPPDADVPHLGLGPFMMTAIFVFIAPGWVVVDAFNLPRAKWEASGRSRPAWVAGAIMSMFLPGIGLIVAVGYWMFIRPKVDPLTESNESLPGDRADEESQQPQ